MSSKSRPPTTGPIPPPAGLSDGSLALWHAVVPRRAKSPERCALLESALRARDREVEARDLIAAAGMTFTSEETKTVHVHPLLRVEKDSRAAFLGAWRALHLEWSPEDSGR
jgi:tryptophan 2,3-dioxygenase